MGQALVDALRKPDAYPHPCDEIRLFETHISWVFLTGEFAYKVKKPVDFGFLDFSTLPKRRFYCEEECRCNSNFAPELYCGVVCISVDPGGRFHVGDDSDVVEFAVKMRQFDDANQLDHLLERNQLDAQMLRRFATDIAAVYHDLPALTDDVAVNQRDRIIHPLCENFRTLVASPSTQDYRATIDRLRTWSVDTYEQLQAGFIDRARDGWIRERHGDLHLSNLVLTDDGIRAFDCIEFSADLRRIDAISDIAFLFMDCAVRDRQDLAYAFVDGYLEATGDYSGAQLLRFYAVYRSLVRAKVAALQLNQSFDEDATARLDKHIKWASNIVEQGVGTITLMCGVSGSGKSWLAAQLVAELPGIRIRSDIVRRQLAGLDRTQCSGSKLSGGIYKPEISKTVYARLLELTEELVTAGENVIVDATFLSRTDRAAFESLAAMHDSRCCVVLCEAPPDVLRQRVIQRLTDGDDPSEATTAVVENQFNKFEEPGPGERTIHVGTAREVDIPAIAARLNTH